MPQRESEEDVPHHYDVMIGFRHDDALRVKMFHRDWMYLQEAINDGREWFVFPDVRYDDTYYVHLKHVHVIRKENPNKAF